MPSARQFTESHKARAMCEVVAWCALGDEAQAAWAQAALSGIAIFFAGLFPVWQRRGDNRRRVASVGSLACHVFVKARAEADRMTANIGGAGAGTWNPAAWDSIEAAMAAVPFHELPDDSLVEPMLSISELVTKIAVIYREEVRRGANHLGLSAYGAQQVAAHASEIERYATICIDAEDSYRPWFVRAWRQIRRNRNREKKK